MLYTPLHTAVNEIPFDWRYFEHLVNDTHNLVRVVCKRASATDVQRDLYERDLKLGRVPEILFPITKTLVTDTLWSKKLPGGCPADKLDAGRLMFFDTTRLGFQESSRAKMWHDAHVQCVSENGHQGVHPATPGSSGTKWSHTLSSIPSTPNAHREARAIREQSYSTAERQAEMMIC
jgi:hypothetical protein